MVVPPGHCTHILKYFYNRDHLTGSGVFYIASMGLTILPTSFLNILTLITIWRRPSFHNPSGYYICNLALSDLGVGVLACPIMMTWKVLDLTSDNTDAICAWAIAGAIVGTTVSATSFFTLTVAIADRYLALQYHLEYPSKVTTHRVIVACIGCWLVALAASLTHFMGIVVFDLTALVLMAPCMAMIIVCYYKIYKIVRQHHNQIHTQVTNTEQIVTIPNMSGYKKTVSVLVYLVVVFFIFYTPFALILAYQKFKGYTLLYLQGWQISVAIIYVSSALNPLMYCWRLKELRVAMKKTFRHVFTKDRQFENSLSRAAAA